MPLVHLLFPFRVAGSRVHSVPQVTITLTWSELLCTLSPLNVTADTHISLHGEEHQQATDPNPRSLTMGSLVSRYRT
jgi:hypothetical protein